jgi:hypothetical protein
MCRPRQKAPENNGKTATASIGQYATPSAKAQNEANIVAGSDLEPSPTSRLKSR